MLVPLLVLLASCAELPLVSDDGVSTIILTIREENTSLVYGAEIYVNDQFKGKTSPYGESHGTKTLVLKGADNAITVEKEGYIPSDPLQISASAGKEQQLTIVLERIKVDYTILVENEAGNPLPGVRVSFYLNNGSRLVDSRVSDDDGKVLFERLDDGNYTIRAGKEEYESKSYTEEVLLEEDGEKIESILRLFRIPELMVEVTDIQGDPLNLVEVSVYTKKEYNAPGSWPLSAKFTNEDGELVFKYVEYDQPYVLVVKKEGYLSQTQDIVLTPEHKKVEFEMVRLE